MAPKMKQKLASILLFILFMGLAFVALFPLYAIVLASFKPATELMRLGLNVRLQPEILNIDNYIHLFTEGSIYLRWYLNSLIITALLIVLCLFFSSMVGYALAIYRFVGSSLIFLLVVFILMVPFEILMLPLYELMISLRLIDTYAAVILPSIVTPIAVFFFRQYALGLPRELLDSGRIDGCSEYGIFFRIMAPLMTPAFAAMAILQGMFSWNNFLWPLVVLRSNEMFTLPIGLSTLLTPYGNNYDILISGSVLTVIPIVILFLYFQRFFVAGLTVGGVKG